MSDDGAPIGVGGDEDYYPELGIHVENVGEEAGYETQGRVDPTYEPAVHQYHAPVAESRSFGSRFWWLIPLLILLIALPFILTRCNRIETTIGISNGYEVNFMQTVIGANRA